MIDFLSEARQAIIENFQISMRAIRLLMGYSIAELAEYVGVTRQTINNLETGKSKMSVMQFLSLAAVVDNYIVSNGDMYQAIEAILDGNGRKSSGKYDTSFSGFSLLRRWFLLFDGEMDFGATMLPGSTFSPDDTNMSQLVRKYKIFVDADALMAEKAGEFFHAFSNYLTSENEKIIIPFRAVEQLQELTQDHGMAQRAVQALKLVNWLQQKNLVQIRGEASDSNLHDTILSVFIKFRSLHRLCLITQDHLFAKEVLHLNESHDHLGFDIAPGYIDEAGKLTMYSTDETDIPVDPSLQEQSVTDSCTIENTSAITLTQSDTPCQSSAEKDSNKRMEAAEEKEIDLSDWISL